MTKEAKTENGLKTVYSINGVGKIGQVHAKKKETRPSSYITHKNKLEMNERLKCQTQNNNNPTKKLRQSFLVAMFFFF